MLGSSTRTWSTAGQSIKSCSSIQAFFIGHSLALTAAADRDLDLGLCPPSRQVVDIVGQSPAHFPSEPLAALKSRSPIPAGRQQSDSVSTDQRPGRAPSALSRRGAKSPAASVLIGKRGDRRRPMAVIARDVPGLRWDWG